MPIRRDFITLVLFTILMAAVACNSKKAPAAKAIGDNVDSLGIPPVITSISPTSYGVREGGAITITGENFTPTSEVSIGGSPCVNVVVTDSTQIQCTTTYHPAAVADVVVSNTGGPSATLVGAFSYNAYLYASNQSGSPALRRMRIDSATGAITDLGTTAAPNGAYGVEIDPTNQWVYAAGVNASQLAGFSINHATGDLTPVAGSPFAAQAGVNGLAISKDGRCLIASNFFSAPATAVSSFIINQTTGALTHVGNYQAGTSAGGTTVDPQNRFVYVANYTSNNISALSINTATCALTYIGNYATGNGPDGIVINPSGKFLYTGNGNATGSLSAFSINQSTGALSLISTYPTSNSVDGSGIIIDNTGAHLYATSRGGGAVGAGKIWGFRINSSTGALTTINSWTTSDGPNDVRIQAVGTYVFAANTDSNTINVFTRNLSSGELNTANPFSFNIGNAPGIIAITY